MRVAGSGFGEGPTEALLEVSRGRLVGKLCECRPKIDLVAGRVAAKALVDVAPHIDRERFLSVVVEGMAGQGTRSAPLVVADGQRFEMDSLEDPANRYFSAQRGVIDACRCKWMRLSAGKRR